MKLSQFDTTIGGEKHTVITIDPGDNGAPKIPQRIHRWFLLDRSGSMSMENKLNKAIDQMQEFQATMKPGDLLSAGWFSGAGQFAPIFIGAKPGDDVAKILERYRYTVGLTCFSEIVGSLAATIKDYAPLVDQTIVDMFTDGDAVVQWGAAEEEKRTLEWVRKLSSEISAFNTIGYGPYYNGDFLRTLSDATENGIFIHSSKITELKALFETNTEAARSLTNYKFDIEANGSKIFHVGTDTLAYGDSELHMKRLAAGGNTFYVVLNKATKTIHVNDTDIVVKDVPKADKADEDDATSKTNFFFAYANHLYYVGERRKALDVLANNVRDKRLADLAQNAFTQDEIGDAQAEIRRAALYEHARYTGGKTGPGYLPARNAMCVMDVFMLLFDTIDPAFYLPFSKRVPEYQRSGRKAVSSEDRFTIDYSEEIRSPVTEIVWNSERPNMSVRFTAPGTVKLNALSAKNAGLPDVVKSFIWRNHSFVIDGNVNRPQAEFLIPKTMLLRMVDKKVPLEDLGTETITVDGVEKEYQRVLINFKKLPVINRSYAEADPTPEELMKLVWRSTELDCQFKVANHFLTELKEKSTAAKADGAYAAYTEDQIRVLEEHGIRKDGSYGGILPQVAKVADSDFYEARSVEFGIVKYATIPSINQFLEWAEPEEAAKKKADEKSADGEKKKASKPKAINGPGQIMVDYYKNTLLPKIDAATTDDGKAVDAVALREILKKEVATLKAEIRTIDTHLNVAKMGKILTNDGFKGFDTDAKGNQVWTDSNDRTLKLEAKRVKVYVDRPAEDLQAQADDEKANGVTAADPVAATA